ncbi:MAG: ABC transporter permease [Lachnospiraceae bacterium]|nr:ABC transporter permease [Lachnospiraceae bacterium]
MDDAKVKKLKYRGRFGQVFIYLGKFFRLFILQSDWKVIPMSAIIAAMVSMAIGSGLFVSMEGTFQASFAITCVCIWNGFFNSIQSICRERPIIKREHRAGMHITSYITAQLIYQMMLCAAQAFITIFVCGQMGVKYPSAGVITSSFLTEYFITLFLITYAADILALMVSAIVHTPMTAMTVMPFLLIVQLVFAGFFELPHMLGDVSDLMISRWGVQGLCVLADYNDLPATVVWNKLVHSGSAIQYGGISLQDALVEAEKQGMRDSILEKLGEANRRDDFAATIQNLADCWAHLILFIVVFAVVTVVFLEFIDHDRR